MSSSLESSSSSIEDAAATTTWSTSWGASQPLLTSSTCLDALRKLMESPTLLAIATEASSHPSGMSSLLAQPWLYAGGGLGNMDECTDFVVGVEGAMMEVGAAGEGTTSLQHHHHHQLHVCLAGGVGKTPRQDTIPAFASVCLPRDCSALDLAAPDFPSTLLQLAGADPMNNNNNNNEAALSELAHEYIRLQQRIYELNEFLQTGWSCGEYQVPFHPWPVGVPYLLLLSTMILLACLGTTTCITARTAARSNRRRRRRRRNGSWLLPGHTIENRLLSKVSAASVLAQEKRHEPIVHYHDDDEHDVTPTTCASVLDENQQPSYPQQLCVWNQPQERLPLIHDNNNNTTTKRQEPHHHNQFSHPQLPTSPPSSSALETFWSAWNARVHWNQIFATTTTPSSTTACLDGLRVGSMLWIVFGHVVAIQSSRGGGYLNPRDFMPPTGFTTTCLGQLLFASRFAVDTFFCISGYLVVHVLYNKRHRFVLQTQQQQQQQYSDDHGHCDNNNGAHQNYQQQEIHTTNHLNESSSSSHSPLPFWTRIFPGLVLHRILRILPLYVMCLGFWTQVAPHVGTKTIDNTTSGGPFWYQWQSLLQPCHDYGWTNLIFVNNFIPFDMPTTQTCFYHSWYIAVDLQLFIFLGPPLVYCYIKWGRRWGMGLTMGFMLLSLLVTVYLSYVRQWSINTFDGAAVARFDVEGYAKPHVRAQAYLAGMFLAMILLSSSSSTTSTTTATTTWRHRVLMVAALLTLVLITFGTVTGAYARRPCQYHEWPDRDQCGSMWPTALSFWYASTSRLLWSLAITAIMGLCLTGHGGCVNSFLSLPLWTVLSPLTYGVYLIHPMVIFVWQLGSREKLIFRLATIGMNYVAVVVISFVCALAAVVVIEYPCANLSRRYLRFHADKATVATATSASTRRPVPDDGELALAISKSGAPTGVEQPPLQVRVDNTFPVLSTSSPSPPSQTSPLNGFHHHHNKDRYDDDDIPCYSVNGKIHYDDVPVDTPKVIHRTLQDDYYGSLSVSFSETTSPEDSLTGSSRR